MKNIKKFICLIFVVMIFAVLYYPKLDINKISVDRINYMDDNEEVKDVLYYETSNGNIKNKYTKDNPLILTPNEDIIFHISYSDDEYATKKTTVESTVYGNDIKQGSNTVHVLDRNYYDQWFDDFKGLRFGFRTTSNYGDARIVIHNKGDWGDAEEVLYVRVVPANSIQVRDNTTGNYLYSRSSVVVDTESELSVQAVLTGGLNMNGNVPSEEYYVGSGFWSWDVPVTNEWIKLENNKWLVKYNITVQGAGTFTIGLGKNGNGQVGSLTVNVVQNKISLKHIDVGTLGYDNVNKNTATKMTNGFNKGDNSSSNRYFVYTGETFTVNAAVPEGYRFELSNSNTLSVKEASSFKNGKVVATYTGIAPGDNEIWLKDGNGNITERFYVQTRYPIYVNSFVGELFKDYNHEYLDEALRDFYAEHNDEVVSSHDSTPQYVKNGYNYFQFYYLDLNSTVKLSTYVSPTDDTDFSLEGDIAMKNHTVENITEGEKAGFKKITAEFYITKAGSGGLVKVGWDTFYMAAIADDQKVHHIDIESTDGGKLVSIRKKRDNKNELVEEEIEYSANIYEVHYTYVYGANNRRLLTINKNEYWQTSPDTSTQYESTSAYITNKDGHLIDNSNRVIDDRVRNGDVSPQFKNRDITYKNIESVTFKVNVLLIPKVRRINTYQKDGNGNKTLVDVTEEAITNGENKYIKDYEIKMNKTTIPYAYNKCPYHSGLDFTVKLDITQIPKDALIGVPNALKDIGLGTLIMITFVMGVIGYGCYYTYKKNNS